MALNLSKTKSIIFPSKGKICWPKFKTPLRRQRVKSNDPNLIKEIDVVHNYHGDNQLKAYKLLGIYFDEYLTFDYHTQYLLPKLNSSLHILYK